MEAIEQSTINIIRECLKLYIDIEDSVAFVLGANKKKVREGKCSGIPSLQRPEAIIALLMEIVCASSFAPIKVTTMEEQ